MKTPFLLFLDGMTGAGKSTTAALLAKQIPRLATIGIDNVKLLISDFERGDRDNNIAREIIFAMTKIYFDHNISVVVDQACDNEERKAYEELAEKYSIPVYKIQLFTSSETAFSRIVERMKSWKNPTSEEQVRKI